MFLVLLWLVASAFAGGPWSGIDPTSVTGLGPPIYLAPQAGWAATVSGDHPGRVRVFVGHSNDEASQWAKAERGKQPDNPPDYPLGDEAWGNGYSLMILRDGNVVIEVTRKGESADLAQQLEAALKKATPWPRPPKITVHDDTAEVDGTWARVTWRVSPVIDPRTFLPRPLQALPTGPSSAHLPAKPKWVEARVWDAYGRYADSKWNP